jgi:hypothetical protein
MAAGYRELPLLHQFPAVLSQIQPARERLRDQSLGCSAATAPARESINRLMIEIETVLAAARFASGEDGL